MSKRLPYYQSEPAEYLAGDIMFCSYAAQGVFSIIRALYWQKDCDLTLGQVKRRCKGADELINELIDEDIIKVNSDKISIDFLDEQFHKATNRAKTNSENGKKGADKKWGNRDSENRLKRSERLSEARKKGTHTKNEWEILLKYYDECLRCGEKDNLVKDHIKPIYQGGSDSIKNLQPLCRSCNSSKGSDSTDLRVEFHKRNASRMPSEWVALREDKIREDKIREDNIITTKEVDLGVNDLFKNTLLKDSYVLGEYSRVFKTNLKTIKHYINLFRSHLITTGETKENQKDYQVHFGNWLRRQQIQTIKEKAVNPYKNNLVGVKPLKK